MKQQESDDPCERTIRRRYNLHLRNINRLYRCLLWLGLDDRNRTVKSTNEKHPHWQRKKHRDERYSKHRANFDPTSTLFRHIKNQNVIRKGNTLHNQTWQNRRAPAQKAKVRKPPRNLPPRPKKRARQHLLLRRHQLLPPRKDENLLPMIWLWRTWVLRVFTLELPKTAPSSALTTPTSLIM